MNNENIIDQQIINQRESIKQRRERLAGNILCALLSRYDLGTVEDQDTITELSVQLAETLIKRCNYGKTDYPTFPGN